MITLKELREEAGLSRVEVAKALNVTVQTIYRYEDNTRRINIEQILILAELYSVSEKEIILSQISNQNAQ